MANRKKTVEIDFVADTSKATREIKNVGDTAEKQGGKLQTMGAKAKLGFAAAAVGVGIAVDFLKDAALAALEDEKAQADLALALQNTTGATDDQIAATEEFIKQTSLATGVADDELRPALETLTRATGDLDTAQGLLATAMDISAATGKPLEAVVSAMGKAINNNAVGPLGRLGLKVKDASGEMLTFDEVMQEAQRTMGGAMETAAGTGAGAMARLQVQWDEAKESLGSALIPVLIEAADQVSALFEAFEKGDTGGSVSLFADDLHDLANISEDPFIKTMTESFKSLGDMLGLYTRPQIQEIGPAARDVMQEVLPAFDKMEGGADDLRGSVENTTDAFYDQRDAILAMTDPVFALADAQRGLDDATADAAAAAKEHGENSPEYVEALGKVRDAAIDVQGAEQALASTTGVTRSDMETHLRSLRVYTEEQIQLMLDAFERINAFRFTIQIPASVRAITGGGFQEFHSGGTVQGAYPGQPVPIVARVGEHVSQSGRPVNGHSGGNVTFNITTLDPQAAGRAVVQALQSYQRSNGAIPIRTR